MEYFIAGFLNANNHVVFKLLQAVSQHKKSRSIVRAALFAC